MRQVAAAIPLPVSSYRYIVLISTCLLCSCEVADRNYYELTAPGGTMSREGSISRLDVRIADDTFLRVTAICYVAGPSYSSDEPFDVGIYAVGAGADGFRFANLGFTVDVVEPPTARIGIEAALPDFGAPPPDYETRAWPVKALIDLSYEDVPEQFIVNLPPFTVGSNSYQPLSVTFTFQRNVDIVPLFW